MIKIKLLNKFETNWYKDYSKGTFLDGTITVNNEEEVEKIIDKFLNQGIIELYETKIRYKSKEVSDNKTTLEFLNSNPERNFNGEIYSRGLHPFGEGFI